MVKNFLHVVHTGSGVPGPISPEVKQPGREDDHSLLVSAVVKKILIYTSTPPYSFMT
jgi:hypothetical protein